MTNQDKLALLTDPEARASLTAESILTLAALEVINLVPRELVPDVWFEIHPCDAPCSFLGIKDLERLKLYWERSAEKAFLDLEKAKATLDALSEAASIEDLNECEARQTNFAILQYYSRRNANYFAEIIAQSETKPCFLAHHDMEWFMDRESNILTSQEPEAPTLS